ncbi:hypothetical protein JTE90_010251, partial [Oedothorax gibbosus]
FCAHPNVQQLLASIWYEGVPGFRRKNIVLQCLEICRIGVLFPIYSVSYIVAPHSAAGRTLRKPFIKFICHSASYVTFLFLLILASQRIETVIVDWFGTDEMKKKMKSNVTTKRGASPSVVEWMILAWVIGLIWSEIKQLWELGLMEYVADMWNIIDFITNSLYVATIALRIVVYFQVKKEITLNTGTAHLPREKWDAWDPILIAEGLFATANIFSSLKLVYIFSVNPHLGPLQICLGRMVIDIVKFFFVYTLVLFAFACGMNQLLWYYSDMERQLCFSQPDSLQVQQGACHNWRRFSNLFESSQTLFWASFGLIDLDSFELTGIQTYTRFWGLLMFGSYCVINVVVLLNLLIAMMNHSYQMISEQADVEWKFARCKLWMSFFEDGATVPPPLNVMPTPKSCFYLARWLVRKVVFSNSRTARKEHLKTIRRRAKQANERDFQYQNIMRNLVRRYVTEEQRKADNQGVTEDDVNEIKQDISSFRYELTEILRTSGFNTSASKGQTSTTGGKKGRQKERRLMKGFDIGLVESSIQTTPEVSVDETNNRSPPGAKMARIARLATRKKKHGRWSHFVEATRHARAALSRSRSEDSLSSQGSSEHPSRMGCSSRNGSSSSSNGDLPSESKHHRQRQTKHIADLPVIKRSLFARKLGNLALSTSKIRLAFMDKEMSSSIEGNHGKNKIGDSSLDRSQAQRTVSAPFSQWLGAKSTSLDHLGKNILVTPSRSHCLTPTRSLSPIPSCASSNVPTPRSSITGQPDTSSARDNKDSAPVSPSRSSGAQDESEKGCLSGSYGIETVNYPTTHGWI